MSFTHQIQHLYDTLGAGIPAYAFADALIPESIGLTDKKQFYAPIAFTVQISSGAIRINVPVHANDNWLDDMKRRFAGMTGAKNGRGEFRTISNRLIESFSTEELPYIGKLNYVVNGKKVRMPTMPIIPIEYSINKMVAINVWLKSKLEDLPERIATILNKQTTITGIDTAIRGDGPIVTMVKDHIRGGATGWSEFVRSHNMNSPDTLDPQDADITLNLIGKAVLSHVRRFIEAAATPIGTHMANMEYKRQPSGTDEHYAPVLGKVNAFGNKSTTKVTDGHDLYQKLMEDALLANPIIANSIVNTIYARPLLLGKGCRGTEVWDRENRVIEPGHGKRSTKTNVIVQEAREARVRVEEAKEAVDESRSKVDNAQTEAERRRASEELAKKELFLRQEKRAAEAKALEAQRAAKDSLEIERARLQSLEEEAQRAEREEQRKREDLARANQLLKQAEDAAGNVTSQKDQQIVDDIISRAQEAKQNAVENLRIAQEEKERAERAKADEEYRVRLAEELAKKSGPKAKSGQLEEETYTLNLSPGRAVTKINKDVNKNASKLTKEQWIAYANRVAGPFSNLTIATLNVVAEKFGLEKIVSGDDRSVLAAELVDLMKQDYGLIKSEISIPIGRHHPWYAQIPHTLAPLANGAYPAYYNMLHTREDMTKDAPYAGDVRETYKMYHLFSGTVMSPPGLVIECDGGKKKSKSRHGRRRSPKGSSGYEEEMNASIGARPPLIPINASIGSRPPLVPINCGMDDEEEDSDERIYNNSSIGGRAPPVIPIRPPLVQLTPAQMAIRASLVPISSSDQYVHVEEEEHNNNFNLPLCSDVFDD